MECALNPAQVLALIHPLQVDFMEKLQREAQEGHLKLLQVSTRVEQLEMNAQSFPGFIQRELDTRLLQEREMQRVVQTQGVWEGNWPLRLGTRVFPERASPHSLVFGLPEILT